MSRRKSLRKVVLVAVALTSVFAPLAIPVNLCAQDVFAVTLKVTELDLPGSATSGTLAPSDTPAKELDARVTRLMDRFTEVQIPSEWTDVLPTPGNHHADVRLSPFLAYRAAGVQLRVKF